MTRKFTLEYWKDDDWFVGKLIKVPNVFSQGVTLNELKENIVDAYHMMLETSDLKIEHPKSQFLELGVEV